ncbi:hypothetical protein PGIGA_G00052910, partial [Pangasianodon gigas]|nr:hypothetical protein [Pangasianodon gigas]
LLLQGDNVSRCQIFWEVDASAGGFFIKCNTNKAKTRSINMNNRTRKGVTMKLNAIKATHNTINDKTHTHTHTHTHRNQNLSRAANWVQQETGMHDL